MKKSFRDMALVVFALSLFLPTAVNACHFTHTHYKNSVSYKQQANNYLQKYNQTYNHDYYKKYLYYNSRSNYFSNLCNACNVNVSNSNSHYNYNYNNANVNVNSNYGYNYNHNNVNVSVNNSGVNVNVNNNNCHNSYRTNSYSNYANNYNYFANYNLRRYKDTGDYYYRTAYKHHRDRSNHYRTKYRSARRNSCN